MEKWVEEHYAVREGLPFFVLSIESDNFYFLAERLRLRVSRNMALPMIYLFEKGLPVNHATGFNEAQLEKMVYSADKKGGA